MAMVINTNISSLNAQRQLAGSANKLGTAMERLSSGLRINSAKDDAAGLAISNRMTTQVTGLNVAQRNANDGISLAQTAEGALSTIGNNLQRIRELAVQSRNATNSASDREALQKEVTQLKAEIDRVAETTAFNGTKLIDGSFTDQEFQVGANLGERIKVAGIANAKSTDLGEYFTVTAAAGITAPTTPGVDSSGTASNAQFAAGAAGDLKITFGTGASAETIDIRAFAAVDVALKEDTPAGATAANKEAVELRLKDIASAINESTKGRVVATVEAGGKIQLASLEQFAVVGGDATTSGIVAADTVAAGKGFKDVDISTVAGADTAILAMDAALKSVNAARADLGAIQNRFESVVTNLATTSENLTASRSRILDADFAVETANLSSAQVLQQAGTAMVAQANQLPQNVLSLLR